MRSRRPFDHRLRLKRIQVEFLNGTRERKMPQSWKAIYRIDDRRVRDVTLPHNMLLVVTALLLASLFALAYHHPSVPVIVLSAVASGVQLAMLRRAWNQPASVQLRWVRVGLAPSLVLSEVTMLSRL